MTDHGDGTLLEEQQRRRTLTEQGQEHYVRLCEQHIAAEGATFSRICDELNKIAAHQEDLAALREIKESLTRLTRRHETLTKDCLDFLRCTGTEGSQQHETHFMAKVESHKAVLDRGLMRMRDLMRSLQAEVSSRSTSTAASSTASRQRAKVEAAKARLQYARKEVELKKQQATLEAELSLLSHEKEVAAAEAETEAEAEVLEKQSSTHSRCSSSSERSISLTRLPPESGAERTANYVKHHCMVKPDVENSTLNPAAHPFDWTNLLLKKELLLNRMSTFNDTPETYISWWETFRSAVVQLSLTPSEEMDLLIKHLRPESRSRLWAPRQPTPETL